MATREEIDAEDEEEMESTEHKVKLPAPTQLPVNQAFKPTEKSSEMQTQETPIRSHALVLLHQQCNWQSPLAHTDENLSNEESNTPLQIEYSAPKNNITTSPPSQHQYVNLSSIGNNIASQCRALDAHIILPPPPLSHAVALFQPLADGWQSPLVPLYINSSRIYLLEGDKAVEAYIALSPPPLFKYLHRKFEEVYFLNVTIPAINNASLAGETISPLPLLAIGQPQESEPEDDDKPPEPFLTPPTEVSDDSGGIWLWEWLPYIGGVALVLGGVACWIVYKMQGKHKPEQHQQPDLLIEIKASSNLNNVVPLKTIESQPVQPITPTGNADTRAMHSNPQELARPELAMSKDYVRGMAGIHEKYASKGAAAVEEKSITHRMAYEPSLKNYENIVGYVNKLPSTAAEEAKGTTLDVMGGTEEGGDN